MTNEGTSLEPRTVNITKISDEPGKDEEEIKLVAPVPTPVSEHLSNVVIAISDSKQSEYAFNWALKHFIKKEEISRKRIMLITIQNQPSATIYYGVHSLEAEEISKMHLNQCEAILRQYRKQLIAMFPEAKVEMFVGSGDPGEAIADFAEKFKAEAVVVGSRGLGMMKRVFLGSTSDYLAHHLNCPVMIIKHP